MLQLNEDRDNLIRILQSIQQQNEEAAGLRGNLNTLPREGAFQV